MIGAAVLCLLCVACPAEPPPPPAGATEPVPVPTESHAATDATLRWGISEPTSIIPLNATTPDDLLVVDALYDSLTQWDANGAVVPGAAEQWAPRGPRRWRFLLRRDGTFSDGTRVTAGHFVRTWSQLVRRGEAHHHLREVVGYDDVRKGRSNVLRGVVAVDDATLDVTLLRPIAEFPAVVGHPALAPMIHAAAQTGATLDRPVGNGSFAMAEPWVHGRFVRVRRVQPVPPASPSPALPDAAGAVAVQEIVFTSSDPASAYIAYEQGGLDVATVPPGGLTGERPEGELRQRYRGPGLLRGELASTYFLLANMARPPLDDVRVRRAVSLAVDRPRLVREVFENNATPAASVLPPAVPGGRRRSCLLCITDRRRARRLFSAAGVGRLTLWVSEEGEHKAVADRVSADLAAVGIHVDVRVLPFDQFLEALRAGRPGLYRFGWTLDYPAAENGLRPLFHSAPSPAAGGGNYSRYARSDVDRLLDRAAATRHLQRRIDLLRAAEDRIIDRDHAIIPIVILHRRTVVSPRVRGLTYGPFGAVDLAGVQLVRRKPD